MGEEPPSLTERNGSALWLAARDRLASSYHPAKANFVPFFFFCTFFPLFVYLVESGLRGSTHNLCGASRTLYLQHSDLVALKHISS